MKIDFKKYPFPEKRPRHHISPVAYVPFHQLKVVPKNYPLPLDEVDWKTVFLNGQPPNLIDVGTGRGQFLLDTALVNPKKNILGLEIKRQVVDWLNSIIKLENIENAGVIWYNVLNGLKFIDSQSIESIYCLFPDPWLKSRHHKRRALNLDVLSEFYRILKSDAKIYLVTDKFEVHSYHIELLQAFEKFDYEEVNDDAFWELPKTNKQISCENRGIPYYRLIALKK
ncbi:MAG: tRNA (guanine(46)-N(7))-methyltransferase TrmB [Candidatus Kapaibacteriales bacterium]